MNNLLDGGDSMNLTQYGAKKVIKDAVKECRETWTITRRELQEVLINLAGELAEEESILQRLAEIHNHPGELTKYNTPEWIMREAVASQKLSEDE